MFRRLQSCSNAATAAAVRITTRAVPFFVLSKISFCLGRRNRNQGSECSGLTLSSMAAGAVSGSSEGCQRVEELLALAGEKTIGGKACDRSHGARKLIA